MPSNSSREDSSDQSSLLTGDMRAKHMASGQAHSNLWGHTGHPRVRVTRSAGKPLPTQLLLLSAGDGPAETEGRAEAVNPSYSGVPCSPTPWMALASKSAVPDVSTISPVSHWDAWFLLLASLDSLAHTADTDAKAQVGYCHIHGFFSDPCDQGVYFSYLAYSLHLAP